MKILKVNLSKNTGDFNVSYSLGKKYICHAETCSQLLLFIFPGKRVVNGNVSVNVTYGVVPSYFNTISLCKIFKCPLEKGNGTFALSNPIEPYFHPVRLFFCSYQQLLLSEQNRNMLQLTMLEGAIVCYTHEVMIREPGNQFGSSKLAGLPIGDN